MCIIIGLRFSTLVSEYYSVYAATIWLGYMDHIVNQQLSHMVTLPLTVPDYQLVRKSTSGSCQVAIRQPAVVEHAAQQSHARAID